jgi:hypothetical protein
MLARHAPQRSHGLHLPAMSSTNDSLDLGAIPRARRLLSDSSQLSDAPLADDDDDDASFADPHDPLADLSLSELSIDPALAARKRKPKFSLFAPRDHSVAPAAEASTIEEDDEEDDDDDAPDVTVRENDRDNDAPDPTIRNAARTGAPARTGTPARPAIGREDALALDLENVRRLNARLRAYHAVLQQTLASRQVRPGRAPPPFLPPTRANAHAPRSTSSRRPRRRTRSSTATSA